MGLWCDGEFVYWCWKVTAWNGMAIACDDGSRTGRSGDNSKSGAVSECFDLELLESSTHLDSSATKSQSSEYIIHSLTHSPTHHVGSCMPQHSLTVTRCTASQCPVCLSSMSAQSDRSSSGIHLARHSPVGLTCALTVPYAYHLLASHSDGY